MGQPEIKRKGGRPRAAEPRKKSVRSYFTNEEYDALSTRAGRGTTRAAYLRACALGQRALLPRHVPEVNFEVWLDLSKTFGNLNQLATAVNSGRIPQASFIADIVTEAKMACRDLRKALVGD